MEPTDYYNYRKNISVVTTPNGDKVITMNSQVFDLLVNHLYDAAKLQKNEGHNATSDDTKELWSALMDKEKESM
jgi:hypothetical protein